MLYPSPTLCMTTPYIVKTGHITNYLLAYLLNYLLHKHVFRAQLSVFHNHFDVAYTHTHTHTHTQ